ncbi:MAG: ABC transporter ATP-binding protein [Candidatus Thorarchaeota archaeon]
MVRIEIKDLRKRFPDGTSIGPISLTIEDGEMMALLGPSGSGKTTTLRMIAGFLNPDGGVLLFDERNVTTMPPRERKIGMVVQSVALFPNMTVYQNIAFALDVAGWEHRAAVRRVEELAELVGVRKLLHRKINEISGGEGQRIALARALALEPELLLLDEPLSALDPKLRQRLQEEIKSIQQELGVSTVYVTHSQSEAFAISDRIAILNDGRIIQTGTPEELYRNPANEFVATFIGGGSILRGIVENVAAGMLDVKIGNLTIQIEGAAKVGSKVTLSVKPEDVRIENNSTKSLPATIIGITPQVGHYRVMLEIEKQLIETSIPSSEKSAKLQPGHRVNIAINPYGIDLIGTE